MPKICSIRRQIRSPETFEQIGLDADLVDGGMIAKFRRLPRLRRLRVAWPLRSNPFQAGSPVGPKWRQLLADLRNSLPDCEVLDHPVGIGF